MSNRAPTPAIFLTAVACLTGCSLIKVNGKPLGGGSSAPSSSSSSSPPSSPTSSSSTASSNAAPVNAAARNVPNATVCADAGLSNARGDVSAEDFADVSMKEHDLTSVAGKFAYVMCTSGTVNGRDAIMAIRARWMKLHGLDDRDMIVLAAENRRLTYESQDVNKMPGPLTQLDGYASNRLVALDQLGARATMFSRFTVVNECLGSGTYSLLLNVLCTREALDVEKAYAEIDSVKELNNGTRYRLRKRIKKTADAAAAVRADLAARAKEDPGIAKVIAIADAQVKEWSALPAPRAQLVAQIEEMEAASRGNKRSAFDGCDAKTRASWEKHLKTLNVPKVPSEKALGTILTSVLDTAEGYLAFEALRLCSSGSTGERHDASFVGSESVRRGPRTATVAAWLAEAPNIKFDARDLEIGMLLVNGNLPLTKPSYYLPRQQQGVIAGIEQNKDTVTITFKTVVEPREDCLKWHETNRVEFVGLDGRPVYRRECLKWGTIKMDLTSAPIRISKVMAHGLTTGMYLVGIEGLGIAATTGAKSSKPIWVLGGALR